MIFEILPIGIYSANCYIIGCEDTNEVVIVDPGGGVDIILDVIEKKNLNVKYIILTHGHGDHIGGIVKLKNEINAPILVHKDDEDMLLDSSLNLTSMMSIDKIEIKPDRLLEDNDIINIGNLEAKIIHTPGHTKGSICIKVKDTLITGDTLFKGSIGRSDLYGGDHETLINSIKSKLLILDEDIKVYPGHGDSSTIKYEKKNNPFCR